MSRMHTIQESHEGQVTTIEESGVEEVNESTPEHSQCFKTPNTKSPFQLLGWP